jgi:aryl-alcohol dehydrogenase-like predicted oxidoreductase
MRLGRERLDGILVHHADNLLADGGEIVFEALLKLKDEGRVGRIGCSVYTGYEIEALLARYSLEILQVPINVLDQRLLLSGLLADIKARGIEIHARSLFLQGILLAPPDTLSARFGPLMPALRRFSEACTRAGASPLAACLAFARRCGFLDYGMVGVISRQQLQDILSAWGVSGSLMLEFGELASPEHAMLNPAHWPAV